MDAVAEKHVKVISRKLVNTKKCDKKQVLGRQEAQAQTEREGVNLQSGVPSPTRV